MALPCLSWLDGLVYKYVLWATPHHRGSKAGSPECWRNPGMCRHARRVWRAPAEPIPRSCVYRLREAAQVVYLQAC